MVARRRKLLLADDSLTIQKVVSLTFSDEGVEVVTASDGAQALRLIAEEPPPDIILADTFMPGPNGYQICEQVKGDPRLRHVPVVLLVGTFEPFNEAEARRVGADMVLTKPFQSIKGLVSKVGSLFGGGRAEEEEPTRPLAPVAETRREDARAGDERAPRPWDEPRLTETEAGAFAAGGEPPVAASAAEVSFADLELDDQMIEAREVEPAGVWDDSGERRAGWQDELSSRPQPAPEQAAPFEAPAEQFAPAESFGRASDVDFEPAAEPPSFDEPARDDAQSFAGWEQVDTRSFDEPARAESLSFDEAPRAAAGGFDESSFAETLPPAPAVGVAAAAATEDGLLDLDDVAFTNVLSAAAPPAVAAEDDDFILDLDDGAPRPQAAAHAREDFLAPQETAAPPAFTPGGFEPETEPRADAPSAQAEAAHGRETGAPDSFGRVGEQTFFFDDAPDETPTVTAPAPRIVWEEQPEQFDAHGASEPSFDSFAPQAFDPEATLTSFEAPAPPTPESRPEPAFEASAAAASFDRQPAASESPVETATTYEDSGASPVVSPAPAPTAEPSAAPQTTEVARAAESPAAGARQIGLADLSPEVIDAIARRVVERMSEGVVREIAWEVVPQLSELLIKQRLDEKK